MHFSRPRQTVLFQKLIDRRPEEATLRAFAGLPWQAQGNVGKAMAHYQDAFDASPEALKNIMRSFLALGLEGLGRNTEALAEYQIILNTGKESVADLIGYALTLIALGRPEEADQAFRKAAMRPDAFFLRLQINMRCWDRDRLKEHYRRLGFPDVA